MTLNRGKYKIEPEKAIKLLKRKMLKEQILQDLKDREFFVSKGRKAYLQRQKAKYINSLNLED